jgi:mRNA-degrading endonuclease toxin of MazEF toxin-antitoxin module
VKPGDIILIDFPFTAPSRSKVRPAVVITQTEDKYRDLLVCAISSVIPSDPSSREIVVTKSQPHLFSTTGLRVDSVIKIDRIATLRQSDVITTIGRCSPALWQEIVRRFRELV